MGFLDTLGQVLSYSNDMQYYNLAATLKNTYPDLDTEAFVKYYRRFGNMTQIQFNNAQQQMQEYIQGIKLAEKPGKACMNICRIRDGRCDECLKMQKPLVDGIEQVKQMERAIADPYYLHMKKFTKCTLCAAPYESGESECPYCGTAYPDDAVTVDLPKDPGELRMLSRRKAEEAWSFFPKLRKMQATMVKEDYSGDSDAEIMLCYLAVTEEAVILQTGPMTAEQLKQGAEKHDTTICGYMYGVINNEFNSVTGEEQVQRMKAENQARRERTNEKLRMMQEQHQRDMDRYQRQLNMVYGSGPPKYVGGGGFQRTCADCTYYSAGARKCGHTGFSTNAGDSCGAFRIK